MSSVQELYITGKSLLKDFPDAAVESKVLILKSLAISEEFFYSHPNRTVSKPGLQKFYDLVSKRQKGIPLAYVTGEKEFWGIVFKVFPGVLIPRSETEFLVEKVTELSAGTKEIIVDIGTGAGNVAVSLGRELPEALILATDISSKALKAARLNSSIQKISNIVFLEGNLFSPLRRRHLEGKCDFIVSNPPYVSEKQWNTLQDDIRLHEPKKALVSGDTGLEMIEKLVSGAPEFLKQGGHLCLEIGFGQQDDVLDFFGKGWKGIDCFKDLSGVPRTVTAQKS